MMHCADPWDRGSSLQSQMQDGAVCQRSSWDPDFPQQGELGWEPSPPGFKPGASRPTAVFVSVLAGKLPSNLPTSGSLIFPPGGHAEGLSSLLRPPTLCPGLGDWQLPCPSKHIISIVYLKEERALSLLWMAWNFLTSLLLPSDPSQHPFSLSPLKQLPACLPTAMLSHPQAPFSAQQPDVSNHLETSVSSGYSAAGTSLAFL